MARWHRKALTGFVLVLTAFTPTLLQPVTAGADGNIYAFNYNVDASTHLKTLNETIDVPGGKFYGTIDFGSDYLKGQIRLPQTTFTYSAAGILPLLTATAKISPVKAVTGTVDLSSLTVTATATIWIRILDAHVNGTTTNLVGTTCMTAAPIVVTMSGPVSLGSASTFSGDFTMPKFKGCGAVQTQALDVALSGPGNTFSATATPAG